MFYSRAVLQKKVVYFPAFFGDQIAEEVGGLEVFLYSADQNFGTRIENSNFNLK
jgi:hypothetical protein